MIRYATLIPIMYFSSFVYLVKLTLSPVYFLIIGALLLFAKAHRVKIEHVVLLIFVLIFVIGRGLPFAYLVNTLLGGICIIVALTKTLQADVSIRMIKVTNIGLILLFALETYIRYSILTDGDITKYFELKYNSFMFSDSNVTGYAIFSVFTVELYLIKEKLRTSKIVSILLYLLLLLTLSKTIIFFSTLMYFLYFRPEYVKLILLLFIIVLFQYAEYLGRDLSLDVRMTMLSNFINYLEDASFVQLALGSGWYGFRYNLYGDEPHSFIMSIVGAGGLISLLIFIIFYGFAYISSKRVTRYYLGTLLLSSIIFLPYYGLIFMYVTFVVLFLLEKGDGNDTISGSYSQQS